ncbi:E3 ubiquitin-protein ligase pub1 [Backusella circina FSU 941]|nr:E3 ubiquitin-protein ligase pub1 [Backusella circina FSU 941]
MKLDMSKFVHDILNILLSSTYSTSRFIQNVHDSFNLRRVLSTFGESVNTSIQHSSMARDNDNGDLPSGWEVRKTRTGRPYYVNHNARTTQWDRPTAAQAQPIGNITNNRSTNEHTSSPLPAGWESGRTISGSRFYIDHNTRTTTWEDPRRINTQNSILPRPLSVDPLGHISALDILHLLEGMDPTLTTGLSLPSGWEIGRTRGNRLFFIDHNTMTTTREDPRLPSTLDADEPQYKHAFRQKLIEFRSSYELKPNNASCDIIVDRKNIFKDSFNSISKQKPGSLKGKLTIHFEGETGVDFGGLSREYFYLLSHELFTPKYGFFEYVSSDNYTLQIKYHERNFEKKRLEVYQFMGRAVGLAIFHRRLIDASFIPSFYQNMLNNKITLADIKNDDVEIYRSLTWILNNDITDVLELTFSTDIKNGSRVDTIDLKKNGRNIHVTEKNKKEYVQLMVEWRTEKRVATQYKAFMDGLHQLIPQHLLDIFNAQELQLLIGGVVEIDIDDWKKNTAYNGYTEKDDVIQWFWKCVGSWNMEMRSKLLQFTTGTSRLPVNGFKDLQGSDGPRKFSILRFGFINQLPKAHTCYNRIDLPQYKSYDDLVKKLKLAVEETIGFCED